MKYPYIGKLKSGNSGIVLFCSDSFGAQLNCKGSGWRKEDIGVYSADDDWDEDKFKNITAEYLANTYGEVKSKAHAEFIVKLTEVAKGKNITVINLNEAKSFVFDSEGCLKFYKSNVNDILAGNLKQITIPLPPECDGLSIGGGGQSGAEFTDTKDDAKQTDSGWPKVGEIVLTASKSKAKVLATHNKKAWVEYVSGAHGFNTLNITSLSKPKTPEQELRDFISLLWDENNHDFDMFLDIVTEHVIKKPQ